MKSIGLLLHSFVSMLCLKNTQLGGGKFVGKNIIDLILPYTDVCTALYSNPRPPAY